MLSGMNTADRIPITLAVLAVKRSLGRNAATWDLAGRLLMNEHSLGNSEILTFRDQAITATQISVVIADANARDFPIVDVNPAFELLTGYTSQEAIGRNCRFLQGPQTDPETVEIMRNAILRKEEVSVTILNYRKDGVPFWNDVHISPSYDRHGNVTHFVGVQSDVTGRKRAEDNRDLLVEASGILAASLLPAGAMKRIAGIIVPKLADICIWYAQDQEVGKDGLNLATPVAFESHDGSLGALKAISERLPGTSDILHGVSWVLHTGETTWIPALSKDDLRSFTMSAEGYDAALPLLGRPLLIVPVASTNRIYGCLLLMMSDAHRTLNEMDVELVRDLGSRIGTVFDNIRLFDEAQGTIRERDHFLSIAAHELRTPVVSIKGYAQFLLRSLDRGTLTRDRLRHSLMTVDTSADRLSTLTNDLLSVSHRNLDQIPLKRQRINIRDYLKDFFSELGPAAQKGYRFNVSLDSADMWVSVDTERLHQVLTILLNNAAKFSSAEHSIGIGAESDSEGVTMSVSDLGIGLLQGETQSIFEPFGRTETSINSNLSGLGMGLFIARTIVERHDGRIWAESEGRDMGTSINVWLPALAPE